MRVQLSEDEWWPVYEPSESGYHDVVVDVPEETLARWKRGMKAFRKLQDEMAAVVKARK